MRHTLELGKEDVDDLVLLDGKGEEVDLLNRLDLSILYETSEFGNGDPNQIQTFPRQLSSSHAVVDGEYMRED